MGISKCQMHLAHLQESPNLNSSNIVHKSKFQIPFETQGKLIAESSYKIFLKLNISNMQWYKINIPILKGRDSGTRQGGMRALWDWSTTGQTLDTVASRLECGPQSVMIWTVAGLNMLVANGIGICRPYGPCLGIALLNTCEFSWQMFYGPIISSVLGLHCSLGFNLMHYFLIFCLKGLWALLHIAWSPRPSFVILVWAFMILSLKLASYRWCQCLSPAQVIFGLPTPSVWEFLGGCSQDNDSLNGLVWAECPGRSLFSVFCVTLESVMGRVWPVPQVPLRHPFYCPKAKC